jgi:methionyl-tRNA formyltransferase
LPQYRGAAPINHAIINGETETGLTTFFIEKEIDTGKIILSRKLPLLPSDDAASLHDKLMYAGGEVMLETLKIIETGHVSTQMQENIIQKETILKPAPKIFKNDCRINWNSPCINIFNLVRGLSPVPCAYSMLIAENGEEKQIKIFKTSFELCKTFKKPGTIITDNRNLFSVSAADGIIHIEELQIEGKKRMQTADFLRGIKITSQFHLL